MEKKEIERLMDKYKAEMLEFSRRNSLSGYPETVNKNDKRETEMQTAFEKNEAFERDRSDPLEEGEAKEEDEPSVPVLSDAVKAPIIAELSDDNYDVVKLLYESCERDNKNESEDKKKRCRQIKDFLEKNPESGTLRVEAFASDRAFGIGSARVMIFLTLPDGNITVFDGLTDIDGASKTVRLPAPEKSLSQSPQTGDNQPLPYAVYSVYVEHPSYVRAVFSNVPVFSGIESVQPVRMLAKAAGLQEPEPIVVDEAENYPPKGE